MIHKPQVYINCINANLWFLIALDFLFLFTYFCLTSTLINSLVYALSDSLIQIHIYRPKEAESRVERPKEEWSTGTWMKGGGPCCSSWMLFSRITRPCPSVYPAPHICHDRGSFFSQWNLVEVICHFQVEPFKYQNLICHTLPSPAFRGTLYLLSSLRDCDEQGFLPPMTDVSEK